MFTTILIALVLAGQPPPTPTTAPAGRTNPAGPASQLKTQREVELKQTVARNKLLKLKKAAQRNAKAMRDYQQAQAEAQYLERMAPIWAKQRADAAALAIAQQNANARSAIAGAIQQEAITDRQRLAVEARQAGYPQVGLGQAVPPPP